MFQGAQGLNFSGCTFNNIKGSQTTTINHRSAQHVYTQDGKVANYSLLLQRAIGTETLQSLTRRASGSQASTIEPFRSTTSAKGRRGREAGFSKSLSSKPGSMVMEESYGGRECVGSSPI